MKTLFIIPGFRQDPKGKEYLPLKTHFTKLGYSVVISHISWNGHVMSDYVAEFEKLYLAKKSKHNTVLGFSFGAMIALITVAKLSPDRLVLCSLSPYFSEDAQSLKPWWKKFMGARRMQDFKQFNAMNLAKHVTIPTTLLYGSLEAEKFPTLKKRIEAVAKTIPKSKLIIVKNAPHNLGNAEYQKAICANIK